MRPTLYRPSNGTEGECFINDFCGMCERDKDAEEGEGCPILAATMAYDVDDPKYPREWICTSNGPKCTAFIPLGDPVPPPRCEATIDMFPGEKP